MESFFIEFIREANLRVTKPRLAILADLRTHPHSSAEEIRTRVTQKLGSISTQAVYDVLHTFTENGLLRCIAPKGIVPRYELQENNNHHHLVCRECFLIINVECKNPNPPCLDIDDSRGFAIDEAEVTFWGVCPECATEKNLELPRNVCHIN